MLFPRSQQGSLLAQMRRFSGHQQQQPRISREPGICRNGSRLAGPNRGTCVVPSLARVARAVEARLQEHDRNGVSPLSQPRPARSASAERKLRPARVVFVCFPAFTGC